jgi:hypothetical protein
MIAICWMLLQAPEGFSVSVTSREGVSRIAGRAPLPDGAVLQISLIRVAHQAASGTGRLMRREAEPCQVKVAVRERRFEWTGGFGVCGIYRVRVALRRIHQERKCCAALAEFEHDSEGYLGSVEQTSAQLMQAVRAADEATGRLEKALQRPEREELSELISRYRTASETSLLSGTLIAHADLCGLYYNAVAIEGRGRAFAGAVVNGLNSNDRERLDEPPPQLPGRDAKNQVKLDPLRRLACREAAWWVAEMLGRNLESRESLAQVESIHKTLLGAHPLYGEISGGVASILQRLSTLKPEDIAPLREELRKLAAALTQGG